LLVVLHNATNRSFYQHFHEGRNSPHRLVNKASICLFSDWGGCGIRGFHYEGQRDSYRQR
jgi:hypothetical protein